MENNFSRRKFLETVGTTTAGMLIAPAFDSSKIFGRELRTRSTFVTKVAVTQATSYDRTVIKQKVTHLFESIGGIGDIFSAGKKVGIKVNLTGGKTDTDHHCTHPEVLRAVTELIIAQGVDKSDIYLVEALWASLPTNYSTIVQDLGINVVDLNKPDPYGSLITRNVGDQSFHYTSFTQNQILSDIDVFVSIAKLKHHYEAGFTGAIKNQIGCVPKQLYTLPNNTSYRAALHVMDGTADIKTHLPKSICDLNLARPIHLAVIDGVKNAHGGEGDWNPTWTETEDNILLAGKDPVATDSIGAKFMGLDPEAAQIPRPGQNRGSADNHLYMLHGRGMGTNILSEIEIVGDGAHLVSVPSQKLTVVPNNYFLGQNFPNPFNPSTAIYYHVPQSTHVTIHMYNVLGQQIETLVDKEVTAGTHEIHWVPRNLSSGVYYYQMRTSNFSDTKKLVYQK